MLWETLARCNVSLATNRDLSERIDGALGLNLIVSSNPAAAGAPEVESTGNTPTSTDNRPALVAHSSAGFSTTEGRAGIVSESTTPSGISTLIPPTALATTTAQEVTTSGPSAEHDVNTNLLGGSAAIYRDGAEEARAKTAEAGQALGAPRNNKPLDAGNSVTDQYSRVEPFKDDLLGAFPNAIVAVEGLLKLGGLVAEVHPIAKVIVGVLKGAWTIIQANAQINEHMHTLLDCMKDSCGLTQQYATSKEHDTVVQQVIQDIAFAVMSGATLINGYAEHQKHKTMLKVPIFFKSFQQDADKIIETLSSLTAKLTGASVASVFGQVYHIGVGVDHLGVLFSGLGVNLVTDR
ncbi:hypothetical protein DL93DRAFT_547349 [Clavulina sp. PMI_390]|nr:hypothetical protein DL93DRAFT_547349 [Clavulina sp. PMI_390]